MSASLRNDNVVFGLFMASLTALSWGGLAIGLKYALSFSSAGTIAQFRFVVASLAMILIYLLRRPKAIEAGTASVVAFIALLLAANFFSFMKGIELTSASNAQLVIQIGPVVLLFLGIIFYGERLRRRQVFGCFVALGGFSLFFREQLRDFELERYLEGNLWVLCAAVTWAFFAAAQKRLTQNSDTITLNTITFITCAIALVPISDFSQWEEWSFWQVVFLSILGLNTIWAYGCLNLALKYAPASQVSMVLAITPILTLSLANLMAHFQIDWIQPEPLNAAGWLGAFLVAGGIGWAQTGARKRPNS